MDPDYSSVIEGILQSQVEVVESSCVGDKAIFISLIISRFLEKVGKIMCDLNLQIWATHAVISPMASTCCDQIEV